MNLGDIDWLGVFNTLSLGIFSIFAVLALARMSWRFFAFLNNHVPVPVLLKRDLLLFSAFLIVFGAGGFLSRILNVTIAHDPLWIVPTSVFALSATAYWVWVEFHLDGN